MKYTLIVIAFFFLTYSITAQDSKKATLNLERFIEETFPVQDGDISAQELYETLLLFYTNPINLNQTSVEELRSLFILSEKQLASFFKYLSINGDLVSIFELQAIPDFNQATIDKLLPFIEVRELDNSKDNRSLIQRILSEKNNFLLMRYETVLEQKRGFSPREDSTDNRYLGSGSKYYTRFRVSHRNDFSIGFTAEKDAGEQFRWKPSQNQFGADFYSGHIQIENQGKLKNIILGDYQLQYGQSLIFGSGFTVGKGAETISTVRRSNVGIRPYTSVVETNFFRGSALSFELTNQWELTTFYSNLKQNATIRTDSLIGPTFISAIQQSGFHRTTSELDNKNSVTEQNYGSVLRYHSSDNRFSLGATYLGTHFSEPLIRANRIYNQFEFNGSQNYTLGLFGDYGWRNVNLFGELARSKSGGNGALIGLVASLSSRLETAILIRHFEKDFHSFYGNTFGESNRNINESGWYWGLKYTVSRKFIATAYFDSFRFPWLRSSINAPSNGYEYLTRLTYNPTKEVSLFAQIRQESKADNITAEQQTNPIREPLQGIKNNYLIGIIYPANEMISFKSRVQWSTYEFNSQISRGYAVWQDVNIDLGKIRLSGRFAIFDTDNFDNAQYAYENDVLYTFSVPAYSGVGTRQYVVIRYQLLDKITLWAKFGRTSFRDRESIGTGLETIDGNKRSDLRLQLRIII